LRALSSGCLPCVDLNSLSHASCQARTPKDDARQRQKDRTKYISLKLQAFVWVLAAVGTVYFTGLVDIVRHDSRVNRQVRSPGSSDVCGCRVWCWLRMWGCPVSTMFQPLLVRRSSARRISGWCPGLSRPREAVFACAGCGATHWQGWLPHGAGHDGGEPHPHSLHGRVPPLLQTGDSGVDRVLPKGHLRRHRSRCWRFNIVSVPRHKQVA
jgi:hypothetical protein